MHFRQSFDLILPDILLPKIDGYTVCEMMRQESKAPIIFLRPWMQRKIRSGDLAFAAIKKHRPGIFKRRLAEPRMRI